MLDTKGSHRKRVEHLSQAPRELAINGKFLSAGFTAVHLVAAEYSRALAARLPDHPVAARISAVYIIQRPHTRQRIEGAALGYRSGGILPHQLWEQIDLPRLARGALLLNLCNLAPVMHRNSVTLIHDAHTFETPESFPPLVAAWYRFVLRRLGRRHRRILTISNFARSRLIAHGIAEPHRIRVIHNGVDHVLRQPADGAILDRLGLRPRSYVLGVASALPHKNVRVLLDAFGASTDSAPRLVLFGAATESDFAARGISPSPRVLFAGRVTDAERRALYEQALCFAFPSTTEGFGLPPAEAMCLGCPILVAPAGALHEVCGDAALYLNPHDTQAWVEAIQALISDNQHRAELTAQGLTRAREMTWTRAADHLLDAIAEVLEEMDHEH